jgi:hypothetical protein
MMLRWLVDGRVRDEVVNRITWRMIRFLSGEILGSEPDPNPLGLGFAMSGVGDGNLLYGME